MNTMSSFDFGTVTSAFVKGAYKRAQKTWERAGKHQRARPPHRYPFQTAHYESEPSYVLERGKTHSYPQEGASNDPREL